MKDAILSAGVIVVRREGNTWHYLLLRAYNYWDFPKGVVEAGEDPLQAARREVAEETGLDDLIFTWGYNYQETTPYGRGKIARYYVAETSQTEVVLPISDELGRPEHHEYRWVSYQEAHDLVAPRVTSILAWTYTLISANAQR